MTVRELLSWIEYVGAMGGNFQDFALGVSKTQYEKSQFKVDTQFVPDLLWEYVRKEQK